MSPQEADWIARSIEGTGLGAGAVVVNVGSSTRAYREKTCPWIENRVFGPWKVQGASIFHLDIVEDEGVTLVGDLLDPAVEERIQALRPALVLCSNVLEHVAELESFVQALSRVTPARGRLLVTVPRVYPFHPDPIDTGYRASPEQLHALFPGFRVNRSDSVEFGSYAGSLRAKPWLLGRDLWLLAAATLGPTKRRVLWSNYAHLFRRFSVTCALLEKAG